MRVFKTTIIMIIMLSLPVAVFAQSTPKVIDIQSEAILELDMGWPGAGWQNGNYIIINDSFDLQYDINSKESKRFNMYNEIAAIYGRYDDSMIIMRRSKNEAQDFQLYRYYPETNIYEIIDDVPFFIDEEEKLNKIFHYKNNEYIITYAVSGHGPVSFNTYIYNADTGNKTQVMRYDNVKVYDISPDRMHLLLASYGEDYIGIYSILENRMINKIYFNGNPNSESSFYFINNDYVFILETEDGIIYDLNLDEKVILNYLKPVDIPDIGISLKKVQNSDYGRYTQNGGKRFLVKMIGEQGIYEKNCLLFRPTTAVLNDDRVRMREWPLLDAKHLAFLEEGEEVEVLDRSGIKVKIGDMEDYWYKIKRSGGQTGWSYGYFLDLAEAE